MIARIYEHYHIAGLTFKESIEVRLVRSFDPNYDWKYFLNGKIHWVNHDDIAGLEFQKEEFEI